MSNKSALCAMLLVAFVFSTPLSMLAQRKASKRTQVEPVAEATYVEPTESTEPLVELDIPQPTSLSSAPVVVFPSNGNVTCAALNASTNPAFAHITENWEFKIDPPSEGPFLLSGSGLVGGMPANTNMSISTDLAANGITMNSFQLAWNSTANITYLISAVIVKGGNQGTNVYPYPGLTTGDIGPFTVTGASNAISHLAFCFEPFTAPSAAPAVITGRVIDKYGRGISNARVQLFNAVNGESTYATTNTFGYYRFDEVQTDNFYVMSVSHKRYVFANASTSFSLTADLAGMDFVASN